MFDKIFNTFMTILFVTFFGLLIYLGIEMNQAQKANNNQPSDFVTLEYKVSRIDSDGIYGDSVKDETGIYITKEHLQPDQELAAGDLIKVYFDSENLVEGIEHVEVLDNE